MTDDITSKKRNCILYLTSGFSKSFVLVYLQPNASSDLFNYHETSEDVKEVEKDIAEDVKEVEKDIVTLEDLLYAVEETRPSVSKEEVEKYRRM